MVQQLQTASLAITVTLEVVASLFCFGRLWARVVLLRAEKWRGVMMWGDICMALAWLFSMGQCISMYQITLFAHFGFHIADVEHMSSDIVATGKWSYINGITTAPVLGLVKSSMILLYIRLGNAKREAQIASYILFWFNTGLYLCVFLVWAFRCEPIRYIWNSAAMDQVAQIKANATDPGVGQFGPIPTGFKDGKYVAGGTCVNFEDLVIVSGALGLFTDFLILLIPMYMVYDLRFLKTAKKLLVILILGLGIAVTAVGFPRLIYTYEAFHPKASDTDPLYTVKFTLPVFESTLAVMTGCVPDIVALIRECWPQALQFGGQQSTTLSPYPKQSDFSSRRIRSSFSTPEFKSEEEELTKINTTTTSSLHLRQDVLSQGETECKGGVMEVSRNKSGEEIQNAIVKTTHFTVQETDVKRKNKEESIV